jgi:hypothetical protein
MPADQQGTQPPIALSDPEYWANRLHALAEQVQARRQAREQIPPPRPKLTLIKGGRDA